MKLNELTHKIIGAAMKVHTELGPGILESAYEACLEHELRKSGFQIERQKELPVIYDNIKIDCGFRIDLLVNDIVIVELKAVEKVLPVHHAQLLSYLRLANKPFGLLINFHEVHLKDGITRKINDRVEEINHRGHREHRGKKEGDMNEWFMGIASNAFLNLYYFCKTFELRTNQR